VVATKSKTSEDRKTFIGKESTGVSKIKKLGIY
jgi:hypothetical protein